MMISALYTRASGEGSSGFEAKVDFHMLLFLVFLRWWLLSLWLWLFYNFDDDNVEDTGGGGPSKNSGDAIVEEDGGAADDEVSFDDNDDDDDDNDDDT